MTTETILPEKPSELLRLGVECARKAVARDEGFQLDMQFWLIPRERRATPRGCLAGAVMAVLFGDIVDKVSLEPDTLSEVSPGVLIGRISELDADRLQDLSDLGHGFCHTLPKTYFVPKSLPKKPANDTMEAIEEFLAEFEQAAKILEGLGQ